MTSSKAPPKPLKTLTNTGVKTAKPAQAKTLVKSVGQALARHRSQTGLTQAKVAGQLGIETETVSRLETGAIAATLSRLEQFAAIYDCPVASFFLEETEDADGLAKTLAGVLKPLDQEERKLLVSFVTEAGRLFRRRKAKSRTS